MDNIQIFQNEQFGKIRIIMDESEEPLFCLTDVCAILGLTSKSVTQRLSDGVISKYPIIDSLGREQQANFVNEDGLYDTILDSRKSEAKQFRKWITSEVLPSIRQNGVYMTHSAIEKVLASPDFIIQLATNLKEEKRKRLETENLVREQLPKVLFSNAVEGSKSSCLVGELAKIIAQKGYPVGEKRLFEWMREKKYLGKCGERYNIPNQQYIEQGLLEIKVGVRSGASAALYTTQTVKVTGKGQIYFVNKFITEYDS